MMEGSRMTRFWLDSWRKEMIEMQENTDLGGVAHSFYVRRY